MIRWRRLAAVTVIPAAAAFALFALQLTLNRAHYPQIPLEGSGFLVRSGLDGSAAYYGEHGDLIYGRSVARQNFPANRPYLFTWRWLFIAGCASMGIITAAGVKHRTMRPVLIALGALVGAYALYAAVFSQAVVIHPYQYDYLLAVPFIALTFAFVPGLIEISLTTRGITAAIVILVACWYAMVEMRNYALRYPLVTPSTSTTGTQSKFGELNSAGEWLPMAYASTNFATDVGSVEVGAADQAVFRYSVIGRTMLMSVSLQSLTAAGNPREIRIAIPDGRVVVAGTGGAALVNNNGAWAVSRYYANSDSRYIAVLPAVSGGTFSTCRRCIYLHFTAMFEIK